jgi:phosphoribosylformylglycinamidine synthase
MTSVNVVYFPGTNCQRETAFAFEAAGAQVRLVLLSDCLAGRARMDDADIVCFPGGFSFGDLVRAGFLAAVFLTVRLADQLESLRNQPTLAICNGFQIAVEAGLFGPHVTLTHNTGGTFQNVPDQPHIVEADARSPWLRGLEGQRLEFPCAHGEGRFVFTTCDGWRPALRYPAQDNPDGSTRDIAGVVSENGLVFGLMNHPERNLSDARNLEIFRNGVRYVAAAA